MSKYGKLAHDIVENVGGKDNINGLVHCITRLRFSLKDESIAKDDVLKNMDGVVTVMKSGGQYQVVIGNHVPEVYKEVMAVAGISRDPSLGGEASIKLSFGARIIDIISGSFSPFLSILTAAGMVKGILALIVSLGWVSADSGSYIVMNAIGDSVMRFMPIVLGYTSAKKMGLNQMTGLAIGMALSYPTIQADAFAGIEPLGVLFEGTILQSTYFFDFFGIPVVAQNYLNSVVPVMAVVAFGAWIQKVSKRIIPEMMQAFFVPFFVLLIAVPVGFIVIGPVISVLTNLLSQGFTALHNFSPLLMAISVGFFWQILVIFGLHWSLVPLFIIEIGTKGFSTVLLGYFGASFAQTAVVAAMYFKLKDEKLKGMVFPAVVSGIMGITEPAIYGLSLPKKKPFIISLFGGAVGGIVMALMNAKSYSLGGFGVFAVLNYIDPVSGNSSGMVAAIVTIIVSMLFGFFVTYFFWNDDEPTNAEVSKSTTPLTQKAEIMSPLEGQVISLREVKDAAFAQGAMGDGVAIIPTSNTVVSPVDGTVTVLFPTLHAIGIVADNGVEILIHVGMDTVQLNGEGYVAHIKQGDRVSVGQKLLTFDATQITNAGYSLVTPVVITNSSEFLDVVKTQESVIAQTENLLTVVF